MFAPIVLSLLQLLATHPDGVSRGVVKQQLETPPEWVDRALDRLQELGVVELRGDLVVPLAPLKPLAQKMEDLARRINRQQRERDQALDLVKSLLHGFKGP